MDSSEDLDARIGQLWKDFRAGTISKEQLGRELDEIDAEIEERKRLLKAQFADFRRKMRRRAAIVVATGGNHGSYPHPGRRVYRGFSQVLWTSIGVGVVVAALVAAATPYVVGLWNMASPMSPEVLAESLHEIKGYLITLKRLGDFRWEQLVEFLSDPGDDDQTDLRETEDESSSTTKT